MSKEGVVIIVIVLAVIIVFSIVIGIKCRCDNTPDCTSNNQESLKMQRLWASYMYYTREFLISVIYDLPFLNDVTNRLFQNQDDIAKEIGRLYPGSYQTVKNLLDEHISIASDITKSLIGHQPNTDILLRRWYENGNNIADAIASLNSQYDITTLRDFMRMHLDTTIEELLKLANHQSGITEFDRAVKHMDSFSNYLVSK